MSAKMSEREFAEGLAKVEEQIKVTVRDAEDLLGLFATAPKGLILRMEKFHSCLDSMTESLQGLEQWYAASQSVNSYFDYKHLDEVLAVRKQLDTLKAATDKLQALAA